MAGPELDPVPSDLIERMVGIVADLFRREEDRAGDLHSPPPSV